LESKKERRSPEDALTNFFITMAQTVKTFPLPDQVEIKRKLFEMFNSVESRIATETTARNYYELSQQLLSSESQEYEYSLLHIS
jgi:hypothetical protein